MGILDDAIREHLDLKRRRGADPTEVERAEREALGPVRRAPEASPGAEFGEESDLAYDHEAGWSHEGLEDEPAADAISERELLDSISGSEPAAGLEPLPPVTESEPFGEREPLAEPGPLAQPDPDPLAEPGPLAEPDPEPFAASEPESEPDPLAESEPGPAVPPPHHAGGQTEEYDLEEALGSSGGHGKEGEDEDVLEETPEFLQDTPDHDRLWFEQRPPKDFDFDG